MKETQIIDMLFLELSQFTQATTAKELALQAERDRLADLKTKVRGKYTAAQHLVGEIREEIAAHLTVECEGWARPLLARIDQRIAEIVSGQGGPK